MYTYLLATGIIHEVKLGGLRTDRRKTSLELCKNAQRLGELIVDLWDAHS